MKRTRHGYWLLVLLPLLMPVCYVLREVSFLTDWFAWIPVLTLFGILPLFDSLIGRDPSNPDKTGSSFYPVVFIPLASALVYLGVLIWSLFIVNREAGSWSVFTLVGWAISLGDIGGIAAINVAHELIHRRSRRQRGLGGVLLSCVLYPGFKLEHPKWHHAKVATPDDPSSAPKGSTVYGQVPRAMVLNTVMAWRLAVQGARRSGRWFSWFSHELSLWWLLSIALVLFAYHLAGPTGVLVFVVQGLVASSLLEVINYIEHYGLRRKLISEDRYEPPGIAHSWNSDFWLSNAILIELMRHPDHHIHPSRPFNQLQSIPEAPQLPLGYAALSLIAFIPPLWRRIIHPRLPV
jgi:alkane 1-monooxygenase